jgi:hypothetical protein
LGRIRIWARIFSGPVPKVIAGLYGLAAFAAWLRDEVAPRYLNVDQITTVRQYVVVPTWPLEAWTIVGLTLLVLVMLAWTPREVARAASAKPRMGSIKREQWRKTNRFSGSKEERTTTTHTFPLPDDWNPGPQLTSLDEGQTEDGK